MNARLFALLVVLVGCVDDEPETPSPCAGITGSVCSGDSLLICGRTPAQPGGGVIGTKQCGEGLCRANLLSCVERLGTGVGGSDPGCAVADTGFSPELNETGGYCDGALDITCDHAFAVNVVDCGAGRCSGHDGYASCVRSETPNPICDAQGFYRRCDGQTSILCSNDLVISDQDCAATGDSCQSNGSCS